MDVITNPIQITTFYKFLKLSQERVEETKNSLLAKGEGLGIRGLFIMGAEGINTTFCGRREEIEIFKTFLNELFAPELAGATFFFKDSFGPRNAFHDLKVKIRNEIVTLERPNMIPQNADRHLSPREWNETMKSEDVVVLDTRNSFEYDIGRFAGAINPGLTEFNEFPRYLENSGIPKDKKVLIYCTGGIRCEKAILEMDAQGYQNVYQLDGGIINYLKEFPNEKYEGECFVFDYRVAVDQNLAPSEKYRLCPHCGDPATEKISCVQCATEAVVCEKCLAEREEFKTCSKNCAHHHRMGHKSKRIHKDAFAKRNAL
jgi:UPF0176 protein